MNSEEIDDLTEALEIFENDINLDSRIIRVLGRILAAAYRAEKARADETLMLLSASLAQRGDAVVRYEKAEQALEAEKQALAELYDDHQKKLACLMVDIGSLNRFLREALAWGDQLREVLVEAASRNFVCWCHDEEECNVHNVLALPRPGGLEIKG